MPILKEGFQTLRQILRALGQNLKELNETMGGSGGGAPRKLTKKYDF